MAIVPETDLETDWKTLGKTQEQVRPSEGHGFPHDSMDMSPWSGGKPARGNLSCQPFHATKGEGLRADGWSSLRVPQAGSFVSLRDLPTAPRDEAHCLLSMKIAMKLTNVRRNTSNTLVACQSITPHELSHVTDIFAGVIRLLFESAAAASA